MIDVCTWDAPGADRYTGTTAAAVASYADIPEPARRELLRKVDRHEFDDMVVVTRDAISGTREYSAVITGMHFGSRGKVCRTVTRNKWADSASEGGLVYCADNHCILIPAVCGNVSRVTRRTPPVPQLPATGLLPVESFEAGVQPIASAPEDSTAFSAAPMLGWDSAIYAAPVAIPAAVPEPGTYVLMLMGLAALYHRRKDNQ